MTNEAIPEASDPDEVRHLKRAIEVVSRDPAFDRMKQAVNLLGEGLGLAPRPPWSSVFPNDLSALACLSRAYRQLRAAAALLMWGYYGEVRMVLRGVYESAALARMLAKEPMLAEKWLRKRQWFPDRDVRQWMADTWTNSVMAPEDAGKLYARGYRQMSAWAHPTAISCLSLVKREEFGPRIQLITVFDDDEFRACTAEIAADAIFGCFALRNAAVDEKAIDPGWRRRLAELASEIWGHDSPHLERDWENEEREYRALQERVQAGSELDSHLREHPRSWKNLKSPKSAHEQGSPT